jgi:hypothetical protein
VRKAGLLVVCLVARWVEKWVAMWEPNVAVTMVAMKVCNGADHLADMTGILLVHWWDCRIAWNWVAKMDLSSDLKIVLSWGQWSAVSTVEQTDALLGYM